MPTEIDLTHLARREWLTGGPLNGFVVSYVETLQHRRYTANTLSSYLRCLAHFSYWMRNEGLSVADCDLPLIQRFLQHHLPTCDCPAPRRSNAKEIRAALHHLLALLPKADAEGSAPSPIATELQRYTDHLRHICGLAPSTCTHRVRHVAAFQAHCFGNRGSRGQAADRGPYRGLPGRPGCPLEACLTSSRLHKFTQLFAFPCLAGGGHSSIVCGDTDACELAPSTPAKSPYGRPAHKLSGNVRPDRPRWSARLCHGPLPARSGPAR